MYKIVFKKHIKTVLKEARTGRRLNHNCEVDMDESIGKNLLFLFILI